jgi:hypothetical protein
MNKFLNFKIDIKPFVSKEAYQKLTDYIIFWTLICFFAGALTMYLEFKLKMIVMN